MEATLPFNGNLICPKLKGGQCQSLKQTIKQAKKSRQATRFFCRGQCFGLCLPLVQGNALYGFLILCHLESRPSEQFLGLFAALNNATLEKAQQELELSKLYQTIRPRAIALSTTHTIYRLISSSLDLDELLPRIARLCLQVLRAKRCLISLVDKKTKRLIPKALIELNKKEAKLHISYALKRIESAVMRSSNTLLKKTYLSVPLIDEEPVGVITVLEKMSGRPFNNFDQEILTVLSEQAVGAIKNAQLYNEQKDMLLGTVRTLSALLRVKSAQPYRHSRAFVDLVLGIAMELGLAGVDLNNLRFAAMLHDAERIGIPEEILKKPAQLSGKEFRIIKEYPKKSVKILGSLESLKPTISIILHHHERFDGTGYPDRLKAKQIPLGARIMAVADSFEAMISHRPYRKSASFLEAIREIKRQSGRQFDPRVIQAFLIFSKTKLFKKLVKEIRHGQS